MRDYPHTQLLPHSHTLVFDPLPGGHHAEYTGHLIEYIRRHPIQDRRYTFVVADRPASGDAASLPECVRLEIIDDEWKQALADASTSSLSGFGHMKVLRRYMQQLQPDSIILMDLTYLELPLCFRRLPCPFAGILFVQYPELAWIDELLRGSRLKFWLKELKTAMLLKNRMLRSIHLLNGDRSADYLNQRFNTTRFHAIPDPVPSTESEPGFDLRRHYAIGSGRKVFLFLGSISERKGMKPLIDAIVSLPEEQAAGAAFVFCGRPEPAYTKQYRELIAGLRNQRKDIELFEEHSFVTLQRMRAMFVQSDCILMPNLRPEYSSGILGHAVAAGTPVIGPCNGLVGRQIQENQFGMAVDINPYTLAAAIGRFLTEMPVMNETARQRFLQENTPERFAERLLNIHP